MAARIRRGDTVQVLTGRSRGMSGTVLRVDRGTSRLVIERVNMVKKHQKPNNRNAQGGIIEMEAPIAISNVALLHNGEPTKVGFRMVDGRKVRWSKKHDEAIDG